MTIFTSLEGNLLYLVLFQQGFRYEKLKILCEVCLVNLWLIAPTPVQSLVVGACYCNFAAAVFSITDLIHNPIGLANTYQGAWNSWSLSDFAPSVQNLSQRTLRLKAAMWESNALISVWDGSRLDGWCGQDTSWDNSTMRVASQVISTTQSQIALKGP